MAMDFEAHWSLYGKGSRKAHRRTFEAYLKKALAKQDKEVAEEIDSNMGWVNPDIAMNHAPTVDAPAKPAHLRFRQLDNSGNAQSLKPVYRSRTGRNLLGTGAHNLVQDLLSEDL